MQNAYTKAIRIKRINIILPLLHKLYKNAKIVLNYSNNFELLVAVILSSQCTDKMVNKITNKLFKKYKTLNDYCVVNQNEFEQDIKSAGFYRNKSKNIIETANIIHTKFNGKVPDTMRDLIKLPGIARKSANVILGNAYNRVEGIAVDTHVKRLSYKFCLTTYTNPDKIEKDLMGIIPETNWFSFTYQIIEYGRNISPAHKKNDWNDPISKALITNNILIPHKL